MVTDMGNVCQIISSLRPTIKITAKSVFLQTKEFTERGVSKETDKTLIKRFKLLGLTSYQVMSDKNMLNKVIQ
jgi:hypothetical protein